MPHEEPKRRKAGKPGPDTEAGPSCACAQGRCPFVAAGKFLGRTWVAVCIAVLLIAYWSWASTMPASLARLLGVRPDEIYGHWLPWTLGGFFAASMIFASWMRLRLNLPSLGAWVSHAGVLLILAGGAYYTTGAPEGDCYTLRSGHGWRQIGEYYIADTRAVFAAPDGGEAAMAKLGKLGDLGLPDRLPGDVLPGGTAGEVIGHMTAAKLRSTWTNDSPNPLPAAELQLADRPDHSRFMLCPAFEDTGGVRGMGFIMRLLPEVTPERLQAMLSEEAAGGNRGSTHDIVYLAVGPDIRPHVILYRTDGEMAWSQVAAKQRFELMLTRGPVRLELLRLMDHAARAYRAEPAGPDEQGVEAVQVRLTGPNGFRRETWLAYQNYPVKPFRVDLPGGHWVHLSFSRAARSLPRAFVVSQTHYRTWPGTVVPRDYRCEVRVEQDGSAREAVIALNQPLRMGELQISQTGAWRPSPRDPTFIGFMVTGRRGVGLIWIGFILTAAGFPWAFYVKPVLLRRRKEAAS